MRGRRVRSGSPYEARYGFARAVRVGERVLVAGTAPVAPPGHEVAPDAEGQMRRCVSIALEALGRLGATADDVVRTRMYLVDAEDADAVGRVHAEAFGHVAPAATMIVVAGLLDPRWRVEIEVEAIVEDRGRR